MRWGAPVLALCAAFAPGPGAAQPAPGAVVAAIVGDLGNSIEAARAALGGPGGIAAAQAIVRKDVAPRMDFARITRDAVGPAWGKAGAAQREALEREFSQLLVHVLARLVVINRGESLSVAADGATSMQGELARVTALRTRGVGPGAQEPMVATLVRGADGWRIVEMRIDGIEVVKLYSANFAVVIERDGGLDGLIRALAARNAANTATERQAPAIAPRPARQEDFCLSCSSP